MSRKISLKRIHAINWFGYNDVLDVHGNLLIAGITGSGKSVLMDVIQLVLVGDQRAKYNQSATGNASTRNLKSYCLGDTKQDIDGASQYMRDKGSITYVALEFLWPNRKQVETWGLRIEFDSAAQNQPNRKNGFFIPKRLKKEDWLNPEDLTGQRTPLDFAQFRRMVKEAGGTVFETLDSYRREMAIPTHLNFDRTTLDYLLPAAMSFTFLKSFNEFCRHYILPAGNIDIQPVKESFLAFRNFERELGVLRDQFHRLEIIHNTDVARAGAERDRTVYQYVGAELRSEAAREAVQSLEAQAAKLEQDLKEDTKRLAELDKELSEGRSRLDSLKAALTATEEGKLFLHLRSRNSELATEIARLKETGRTIQEAVQARIKNADRWLNQVGTLPVKPDPEAVRELELAALELQQGGREKLGAQLRSLALGAQALTAAVRKAAEDLFSEESELLRESRKLEELIGALKLGVVPEASILLNTLNHTLLRRGADNPARALRELCEVTDEAWRPAIEVAFGRKFAVVVDEKDFDEAERAYHSLKHDAPRESLINPAQALAMKATAQPGSLAEKIETSHPVARRVVDQALGDLICVDSAPELRKHSRAILRDGFMYQRPFVERRAHYRNNPCVGQRGLEKQREFLQTQLDDFRLQQRILEPKTRAIREFLDFAKSCRLEAESVHEDLAAVLRLEEKEAELKTNLDQMRLIRESGIEEKESQIAALESQLRNSSHERDRLLGNQKQSQLIVIRRDLDDARHEASLAEDRLNKLVADGVDISRHLTRREELRAWVLNERPTKEQASELCRDKFHEANTEAQKLRTDLVAFRRELAMVHPLFMEFDPEAADNAAYDARLAKIQEGDIPGYEEKARREKSNWQHLFRTQVLAKLHAALFDVENLLAVLNQELRSKIGNNQYKIIRSQNPDKEYKLYRNLVDQSAAVREDDLFFASMDAEVRQAIEDIFLKLVEQPESKEALAFLDYRNYHDYDMKVLDTRTGQETSVDRHSGKFSGGENQSPYFIAILACYLRAYHRYEKRRKDPSLAIVPIDEAFSKLSGERIRDCIGALQSLDLQGVFSMSSGNIPYAMDMCDQIITVMKRERMAGRRQFIRNIPVAMTREEAIARYGGHS
jgi:uncharacterized protein YPO0396